MMTKRRVPIRKCRNLGAKLRCNNLPMRALRIFIAVSSASLLAASVAMAQPLPCKANQLIAAEDRNESDSVEGGLGHHAMTIAVRNRSSAECVLKSEPAVTLLGQANRALAVRPCANCVDGLFDKQPVQNILLKPNDTAYLVLGFNINDSAGTCRNALTVSLGLPNKAGTLIDVAPTGDAMRSCGKIDVTPFLRKAPMDGLLPRRDSGEARMKR
jgi:Protein of unknown function (DUF4232)